MPDAPPRMTQTTQAVLRAMLVDPSKDLYGLEICAATGLPSGTVHPILARFEALGWLDSAWEQVDPREQGRPRRRYYRLNPNGVAMARDALARAYETRSRIVTRLKPAGETA
jgi:PadR family transcriptional regulator PadR